MYLVSLTRWHTKSSQISPKICLKSSCSGFYLRIVVFKISPKVTKYFIANMLDKFSYKTFEILPICGQSYKHFTIVNYDSRVNMGFFQVRYESRVVHYDLRGFIRLATGHTVCLPHARFIFVKTTI